MNELSFYVFLAALIIGSGAIIAVIVKYLQNAQFSMFTVSLLIAGIILIGLSVFTNVSLKFGDLEFEYETLKNTALAMNAENEKMKEAMIEMAKNNNEQKNSMKKMLEVVNRNQSVDPVQLNSIQSSISNMKVIDTNRIKVNPRLDSLVLKLSKRPVRVIK